MITSVGLINSTIVEDFSIVDENDQLINNIDVDTFSLLLFDPDDTEVSSSIAYDFENLGNGHYRLSFIPNKIGTWFLVLTHPIYVLDGKYGSIDVYSSDTGILYGSKLVNEVVVEDFSVLDDDNNFINNLNLGEVTYDLYDPYGNNVNSTVSLNIINLGNGNYRSRYTPTVTGGWYLIIYNSTYFVAGKGSNVGVVNKISLGDGGGNTDLMTGMSFPMPGTIHPKIKRLKILKRRVNNKRKLMSIKLKKEF